MLSILSCVCGQSVYLLWRNVYLGLLPVFGLVLFLILLILALSLFFVLALAKGLSILFIFSKNPLLISLIFSTVFFVSISFISDLILIMISFLLPTLGFLCSSFSSCFKCWVRLFIWDFSCFFRWDWIAINFPLRTAFAAYHRFWVVVFSLSFVPMYFLTFFISSVISSLFSSAMFSLHVFMFFSFFPVIDLQSHSVVVRKEAWYDFNFLKFSEALFVTQDVIYPGECSMCTWEESVFCCFWVECSININ